ncbi:MULTISPECIES: S9 family peptidase [unclassified Ruegeria]|uniref:alpha/beta hydrolase family protein n=1 Tax=unclassified Ruegeria TaxID=2625375 RepID=UPI001489CF69|nr:MULTISPECIES: alpha/beta fold hydrolase [unclassified Ruegeria]
MKRFFKWLLALVVLLGTVGGGTIAWLSRDTAPTHASLKSADLPPIIPIRDFFANTGAEWEHRVSIIGTYVARRAVRLTKEVVILSDAALKNEFAVIENVDYYFWSNVVEELHVSIDDRLWRVNPSNADRENWMDVTPRGFQSWFIVNQPETSEDPWIVSSRDRNPAFADLYKTRLDGGGKELFIENEGQTLGWAIGQDHKPVMRFDRAEKNKTKVLVFDDPATEVWRELFTLDAFETFWVHEVTVDRLFAFANSSRGRDKSAVVKVDLQTGAEEVLAADERTDIFRVVNLSNHDGQLDLALPHRKGMPPIPLSEQGKTLRRILDLFGNEVMIDGIVNSGGSPHLLAFLSPEAKNYQNILIDLEAEQTSDLGDYIFRRDHLDKIAPTEEVFIPARDGLEIPALLVRPLGVDDPVPMVLEVHGGPASHVEWEYNNFRQFLVNRGYAVLSVNFRGSTGYGRAFQSAAFGQFGRAMQTDLYDAVAWAVENGIADPEAVAINGSSYGGYASAMAATDPDGPFAAAIIEHAVLDVEYQMRNNPFAWGLNTSYLERYFGSLNNPDDVEDMRAFSPSNRIDGLQIPVMIVAGKRDRIVGFEQSEEFLRKAREAGLEPEELIFEDEGHGIDRWQNSIRHARRVEEFLTEHLGGRSGGFDYIEIAVEVLD